MTLVSAVPWTRSADLHSKMKGAHLNRLKQLVSNGSRICIDSRNAAKGSIFFALQGDHTDGNRFAEKAIHAGCALAVIDNPAYNKGDQYLLVDDALASLQALAQNYRQSFDIPILGITGTNGKTTTKELTHAVLAQLFASTATQGNLNNHIGVPLSLLTLQGSTQLAIIEMGANHVGEIARLCELAMPTHAIITNIGKAHIEGFGSVDNIETAKSELFKFVTATNGIIFVNNDDERLKKHGGASNAISFGHDASNHCSGEITNSFPFVEVTINVNKDFGHATTGMECHIKSQLTGSYNFGNIMAAVTAGLYFGVPPALISQAIADYEPKNNRSQVIKTKNNTVLMDAYNANPTSMAAALQSFRNNPNEPKAVMLGDMLELGHDALAEHAAIARNVHNSNFALQVFVGKHFAEVCTGNPATKIFIDVDEARTWLKSHRLKDHQVFVKGSRGIQMEKLLDYL